VRARVARSLIVMAAATALVGGGVLVAPPALAEESGVITTVAGGMGHGPAATVGQDVAALAYTPDRIWVIDQRMFPSRWVLRTIDRGTGQESAALRTYPNNSFRAPSVPSIAARADGTVLVAYNDSYEGSVERVWPDGAAARVAGGGKELLSGIDGLPATSVRFPTINGLAVRPDGTFFFSVNGYDYTARQVTSTFSKVFMVGTGGRATTYVNENGRIGGLGDGGPALTAQLSQPMGLALDPAGNLFIADIGNRAVRKVSTLRRITTIASVYAHDLVEANGTLYLSRIDGFCGVQRWTGSSLVTVAGTSTCGWSGDGGPALAARAFPIGLAADGDVVSFVQQATWLWAREAGAVRTIEPDGTVRLALGTGTANHGGDGGPATAGQLGVNGRVAPDRHGGFYVSEQHWLRHVAADGTLTTVAGAPPADSRPTGTDGGPATDAWFSAIEALAVSPSGEPYFYDDGTKQIHRVDAAGMLHLVAGNGSYGLNPDGAQATSGPLGLVRGMAFAADGSLYFGLGCLVRRIDPAGVISTVAGDVNATRCYGTSPDGVPALGSALDLVNDIALDPLGRVVFVETDYPGNKIRARRVGLDGVLTTVAGGGTLAPENVQALDASLNTNGLTVAVDPLGRVLLADRQNGRVYRVEADGTIHTVIGGGAGADGGPALGSLLYNPHDIAVDATGDVYLDCFDARPDGDGGVVRRVSGL